MYVANPSAANGGSITVYPLNSDGNVKPIATIAGSATGLAGPFDVSVASDGEIYVANYGEQHVGKPSITVYPSEASGNVAPIRRITFPVGVLGIAVDASGFEYVTGGEGAGSIYVFAPLANGLEPPVRTITGSRTQLAVPTDIEVDGLGDAYVTNGQGSSITVYAPGANGNVAPIQDIHGSNTKIAVPKGVALDSSDNIYVSNYALYRHRRFVSSVWVYAKGATGNVPPFRMLKGGNTKLSYVGRIALDSLGNVYVANGDFPRQVSSVTVYAAGSEGNVRPIRTIKGDRTGLNQPQGISIH